MQECCFVKDPFNFDTLDLLPTEDISNSDLKIAVCTFNLHSFVMIYLRNQKTGEIRPLHRIGKVLVREVLNKRVCKLLYSDAILINETRQLDGDVKFSEFDLSDDQYLRFIKFFKCALPQKFYYYKKLNEVTLQKSYDFNHSIDNNQSLQTLLSYSTSLTLWNTCRHTAKQIIEYTLDKKIPEISPVFFSDLQDKWKLVSEDYCVGLVATRQKIHNYIASRQQKSIFYFFRWVLALFVVASVDRYSKDSKINTATKINIILFNFESPLEKLKTELTNDECITAMDGALSKIPLILRRQNCLWHKPEEVTTLGEFCAQLLAERNAGAN